MNRTASDSIKDYIKSDEELRLFRYADADGYAIGYGHKLLTTEWNINNITKEKAEEFFAQDIKIAENKVNSELPNILNQNQFDALVSLVYNVGITKFNNSILLSEIKKDPTNKSKIQPQFDNWVHGKIDGKFQRLENLVRRRAYESNLYFTKPKIDFKPIPKSGTVIAISGILTILIVSSILIINRFKK